MTDNPEAAAPVHPGPQLGDSAECLTTFPCAESWYEQHINADSNNMVLLPLTGWGYKQDGSVVGLRAPHLVRPEGYLFRGYVLGRQAHDYEMHPVMGPDGKPTGQETAKVITYDNIFMQWQLQYLKDRKDQMERRAKLAESSATEE